MMPEFLYNISPVVKILLLFVLILAGNRIRVNLGIALVIGALIIDF